MRPHVLATAAALAVPLLGAGTAHADPCIMDPMATLVAPVQITGKRYVDGEQTKVRCKNNEGHTLDATTCGVRTFQLVDTVGCTIFADSPTPGPTPAAPTGVLTFHGNENRFERNTFVKARYVFGGSESGGRVAGVAEGVLKGKGETPRDEFVKDKGTLTYSYEDQFGRQIVFVGTYKAKFPPP
jgi:hypothetical protein